MGIPFEKGNDDHSSSDSITDANDGFSRCSERDKGNEKTTSIAHSTSDHSDPPGHPMTTRAKDGIHKPKKFPSDFKFFTDVKIKLIEPINIEEALSSMS